MWIKIKILLFYAVIIDGYVYFLGKNDPWAPFYGLLLATSLFIPGMIIYRKIKFFLQSSSPPFNKDPR